MRRTTVSGLALFLAFVWILVPGCGSADSEAVLSGSWFGPTFGGSTRRLVMDGSGTILQYYVDGTPEGVPGTVKHVDDNFFEVTFEDGTTGSFLLSASRDHAALYVAGDDLVALQRDASVLSPDGYVLPDVAPGDWAGTAWFLDDLGLAIDHTSSSVVVESDATFEGLDGHDRLFLSPLGDALEVEDGVTGIFASDYEDQYHTADADITLLMTPDKAFVVAFANWDPWGIQDGWIATWVWEPLD